MQHQSNKASAPGVWFHIRSINTLLPPEKQPSVFLGSDDERSYCFEVEVEGFFWNLLVFSSVGRLSFTLVLVNFVFMLPFVECSRAREYILCMHKKKWLWLFKTKVPPK